MTAANPAVSTRSTLSHRPFGGRCSLARERRAFRRVRRRRHPRRADAGHGTASQASANALSCVRVCVYVRARFCICVRACVMVCVASWLQVPALRGKPALPGAQPRAARVLQPGRRRASTGWPPRQTPSARCRAATVHMPAAARQAPRSTEAGRSLCSSGLAWCVCVRQICKINMQEYAQNMQNMQVSVSVRILHIYSPPTLLMFAKSPPRTSLAAAQTPAPTRVGGWGGVGGGGVWGPGGGGGAVRQGGGGDGDDGPRRPRCGKYKTLLVAAAEKDSA